MASQLIKEKKALHNLLFPELGNYWDQFQVNLKRTREKARPDAVHDLRVSIRRLRSVILLFKEISLPIKIKASQREMKSLMRIFGRLRDMHIQYNLLKKSISRKKTFLDSYLSNLNSRIMILEKKLQFQVRRAHITKTGDLVKNILSHKTFPIPTPKSYSNLRKHDIDHIIARGILQKYLMKCFSLLPIVKNKNNLDEFHKLRINIKKLRYKLEILYPLVFKDSWKKVSTVFRTLQNLMGEVHDIDVAFQNIRLYFEKRNPRVLKSRNYILWLKKMQKNREKLFRKSIIRMKNLEKYDFFSH